MKIRKDSVLGFHFSTFILLPSRVVGSSLQYLCKEYLKAVVHQEFSDIDSDSGTYSDANGIKKAPAIATPARQTRGFCKAVACAPFLVGVCP